MMAFITYEKLITILTIVLSLVVLATAEDSQFTGPKSISKQFTHHHGGDIVDNFIPHLGVKKPILDHYGLHDSCLEALNDQINEELYASMVYMNMAGHFNNPRKARPGFGEFFRHQSLEEYGHAQILLDYINLRNGTLGRVGAEVSPMNSWDNVRHALDDSIKLEKTVYSKLHHLHSVAEQKCQDWHLVDFIESKFFSEQVESINELYTWLTLVEGTEGSDGSSLGEYLVDQQMTKNLKHAKKEEL